MRTYDIELIIPAVALFLGEKHEVDINEWIENSDNIALINEHGDMALFEKGVKHVYTGHYYFTSRGRKAINSGHELLDELFNSCYNIDVVTGLSPITNLGARWISRQLGFTSHGIVQLYDKYYELFILTKKDFNNE